MALRPGAPVSSTSLVLRPSLPIGPLLATCSSAPRLLLPINALAGNLHIGAPAGNKSHLAEKRTPVWLAIWRTCAGFANSHTPISPNKPTNSRELKISYASSTTNTLGIIENNSERLEGETTQGNPLHSNPLGNSPANTLSTTKVTSTSTRHHQDTNKGELNMGEYMRTCLMNNITALVEVRKGMRPQDDLLFWM